VEGFAAIRFGPPPARSLSPDVDPVTGTEAALTVAGQLPRASRLLKRVAGVSEFTDLIRRVVYEVRRDGELAPQVRDAVADALEGLRIDPDVNRVAHRLITESDPDALAELERMFAKVFGDESTSSAAVAARVVHWIELTLPKVVSSDRQAAVGATRLMGGQLRRDVAEGFGGIGEHLARQEEKMDLVLELAQDRREVGMPPAVDWAPDWPQKALRALAEVDAHGVERLRELVDGHDVRERLVEAVADPPGWMRDGSHEVWAAVARYAEYFGEWPAASTVWERLALDRPGEKQAMWLLRAAMDAHVAGDADRHQRLLGQAREADPDHPRVQLELATLLPYAEQRERIAAIVPDGDETAALLKCHLALHAMLAKDLAEAERLVDEAQRLAPDLVQVRTLVANVAIERNRRAIGDNEPLDVELAEDARRQILAIREELLLMRRWDETHRLLMLAVDSYTVAGEFGEAETLLLTASPEEREGERGEALAEAALRAMRWMTAGVFLAEDNQSLTARRIRARAKGAYGTPDERKDAARELDAILDQTIDPDDRQAAALSRLVLCLRDPSLPWSDEAELAAIEAGEAPSALGLKALWLTDNGDTDAAIAVVKPHLPDAWALEARYHIALKSDASDAPEWAAEVLATNPDQLLRMQCAATLQSIDPLRAKAEFTTVAKDRRAQKWVRVEAYGLLVVLLLSQGEPESALREIATWQQLDPGNDKASALWVTASARLAQAQDRG
jgi:hypothetical protein